MNSSRLLLPDVECPSCRKRPRVRVSEWLRAAAEATDPGFVVQTYQCHRCHTIYNLTAGAFARAG